MSLLSIIIPTYNSANAIKICISSILGQSFTNFEILVIDRVSTDDTVRIATSFNDSRIIIYSEEDKGIYDAMNKGIRFAKGKWLYFLGSDDYLFSSSILEKIFSNAELNYNVIYGNVISPRFGGWYNGEFTIDKLFEKNICHQAIFFEKKIFKITGIFNLKYRAFADWDHNLKWFISEKIQEKYIDEIIAYYADGGFSSQNSDTVFLNDKRWNFIKFNRRRLTFLNKIRLAKAELLIALQENRKRNAIKILIETPLLFT